MNGSVSVPTPLSSDNSTKVATTAFVTNKIAGFSTTNFVNDVSMNQRLSVLSDVSFNGKMFVSGDVSLNGNVSVPTPSSSDNSTKVATTAFVTNKIAGFSTTNFASDVSMNQRLNVLSDVSLNKRLFVGGDASLNGNIYVTGNLIANYAAGSIPSAAIFGISNFTTDVSMNERLFVLNDVSFGGRLNVSNALVVNIGTNTTAGGTVSPNAITNTSSSGNTWNTNGVTWNASVSTLYTAGIAPTASLVFNSTSYGSFLNVDVIGPNSGSYNTTTPFAYSSTTIGTSVSGSTIYGEWAQIQSSTPLLLNSYSFYTRNNFYNNNKNYIGCLPGKYTIAGSNDGSTWFKIQDGNVTALPVASAATNNSQTTSTYTITTSGTATQSSNNSLTGYAAASNTYTYFRIIVTNLIGNGTYGATSDSTLSDSLLQFGWTPTFNVTTSTPYSWVGIGKTNPICPLDISGLTQVTGDVSMNNRLFVSSVGINQSTITSGFALDVNGNIRATGTVTQLSDYRIKTNVQTLDGTFTVDNLRPISYHNILSNNQDIGLIAHELQQQYPFLVHGNKDDNDYQSVNYTSLISVLIHEIQQLKKRITKLENIVVPVETTEPVVQVETTEPVVQVENTEPVVQVETTEPVVQVENTDQVVQVENADPVVPVENTEPVVPVETTEPVVQVENTEPVVPVENTEPVVPVETTEPVVPDENLTV
jgi:hypothetical protein